MVRVTNVLCRVPVIKFRKGGLGQARAPSTGASAGAAPAVATPAAAPVQVCYFITCEPPVLYFHKTLSI